MHASLRVAYIDELYLKCSVLPEKLSHEMHKQKKKTAGNVAPRNSLSPDMDNEPIVDVPNKEKPFLYIVLEDGWLFDKL